MLIGALALLLAAPAAALFEDVTERSGVRFVLENGASESKYLIETMPGGVAVLDADADGRPDLFFVNGASVPGLVKQGDRHSNRLFRNNGDGTFTDITAGAGVAGEGYGMAAAAADYDNDGRTDLFVAGVHRNTLYRNLGSGRFADVTDTAFPSVRGWQWSVAAGWLDFDNDGRLDLFLVNYVIWSPKREPFCGDREKGYRAYCHPELYSPTANQIFRNNGDGTFSDISVSTGLAEHRGKGMALAFGDADSDGDLDAFVTNDTVPNFLFLNEGGKRWLEAGLEAGVAFNDDGRAISSMGADFRDFDNDGRDDIVVTALANETFPIFRNLGKGLFKDVRHLTSLGKLSLPNSGWGVVLADFNNDGWKDLFTANGDVQTNSELFSSRLSRQTNTLLLNHGPAGFRDASAAAGFRHKAQHRGAVWLDLDADGRLDLAVSALGTPALLLRNASPQAGHWLGLRLEGTRSNRQGIGARAELVTAAGRRLHQFLSPACSYGSSTEPVIHFGLGAETGAESVRIVWPSGARQTIEKPAVDRYLTVREPMG